MIQRRGRIAASHWPRPASGTTAESALCRDAALLPVPPAGGAALRRQRCGTATPATPLQWKGGRERKRPERVGRSACASARAGIRARKASARAQSAKLAFERKAQRRLVCVCAGRFIRSRTKRARAREARRVCVRTLNGNLRAGLLLY